AGALLHALPERDRAARIVARARHEEEADVVRLRLLRSAVRQQHADLRAESVRDEDDLCPRPTAEERADDGLAGLRGHRLAHAFSAVAPDGMTDLVTEDDREHVGVDCHRQAAGLYSHLPARQRKGVLLLGIVDDRDAPAVVWL